MSKVAWVEGLKQARGAELGSVAAAAALAALPVGAFFLLAAFFLGVLRGGALLGRLIAVTADLLSHGAVMRCC